MQFPMTLELLTCLSAKIFWAMPKLVKNLKALKEIFIIQREERERLLKDFVFFYKTFTQENCDEKQMCLFQHKKQRKRRQKTK